jgi:hypothetical protein
MLLRIVLKHVSEIGFREQAHPEEGDSPPRDRTKAYIGSEVKKIISAACTRIYVRGTESFRRRTVPHAVFADVQDDML